MQITPTIKSEFQEQISEFFNRAKSQSEGEAALAKHCNEMLQQLPDLLPLLKDYPAYGAMAFYGKMQVVDKKLITTLASRKASAKEAIEILREKKALRVAATAKSGWDLLLSKDLSALWGIIQLNATAPKPVVPSGPIARDCEVDENGDALSDDPDDENESASHYDDEDHHDDDDLE